MLALIERFGSLITGGAGLLGSMFSSDSAKENNAANIAMQRETNAMQVAEAEKNRQFQNQMSSTAYQRASGDMMAAGLNPMMMFGHGGSASTAGGAQATLTAPQARENPGRPFEALGDVAAKAVSSAVQTKTIDKMADEMANLEVENTRIREQAKLIEQSTRTEAQRTKKTEAETKNIQQDTLRQKLDRARQEFEAIKYIDLSGIPDAARKAGNIGSWAGGKVSDTISPLLSSAVSVKKLLPQRSTSQRSRVDSSGKSFDEFWENRTGF